MKRSKSQTRGITRLLMLGAWALALVGGWLCVATVLDADSMWTARGKVLVASNVPALLLLAIAVTRWHYAASLQSPRRPLPQGKPWRGDEYDGSSLDYSYLRDDQPSDPLREAKQRTI